MADEQGSDSGACAFTGTAYDIATLEILVRAHDDAWRELQIMNIAASSRDGTRIRSKIVRRILAAAAAGERDPDRLKLMALHAIDGRK